MPHSSDLVNALRARTIGALALALGLFHLANVSGLLVLSTMVVRAVHLTAMLSLIFLLTADPRAPGGRLAADQAEPGRRAAAGPPRARRRPAADPGQARRGAAAPVDPGRSNAGILRNAGVWVSVLLFCAAMGTGVYLLARWEAIAFSGGATTATDIAVGVLIILLVVEAARRAAGNFLAVITAAFLAYPLVSPWLPGVLYGRGVRIESVVSFLSLSGQGIYGIPIGVASTYIILFTIFGAFLSEFGAGGFFFRFSTVLTRGMTAASAKTAVVFSTLLGMISGSAAGNVAVTGSFTIPVMKREGYRPHQAGAIEAVVSTGGQIMPPVMGAAAFIMAEIVGTPYVNVMKAGLMPALLFFVSVLVVVHLQALKSGLRPGAPEAGGGPMWRTLWNGVPFVAPFIALVGMMVAGYSPVKASFYAIALLLGLHLLWTRAVSMELVRKFARAVVAGVRSAVPISAACAAAGVISGILSVTGLGSKLSIFIISLSGGVPAVGLLLTMVAAIVLGMGLPTTAAYLILATVVAPALAEMGVPLLTAHMFVFFFGCVSTITPPVALASFVAAGVAHADVNRVGWTAFRYGLVCYLLPFAFFFGPALLAEGSFLEIGSTAATGVAGVFFLAAAIVGYLRGDLSVAERAWLALAGASLLDQGLATDAMGLAAAGLWLVYSRFVIRPSKLV